MSMTASWWQSGTIYQIYPRSFRDSNGDGVGDLAGIQAGLDYVASLGVDAIWISPIYPSPMADFGYDVKDYCDIDPMFGTLADFDRLIESAHAKRLKVILDFVPNHTSIEHPWFIASRASRTSPRRDWYIWRDPKPDGGPPNNWMSNFGGSAWTYDVASGQYYYHAFLREQPDLNWRNPQVRAAMFDVLRFWMQRGVDGFRVDVLWHLLKDELWRDNPPNPDWREGQPDIGRYLQVHSTDQPDIHELVAEMRRVVDEYPDRVLIGEIYLPIERLVTYYGQDLSGAHLPFNFQLISAPWDARHIDALVRDYERLLPPGGWPNWVLGNHDQPRIASRVGVNQARVAMLLLLTLRGTPTIYQGDELGLEDVPISVEQLRDPWAINEPGHGRDPQRTPLPWTGELGAGFTTGRPWLPIGELNLGRNIAGESASPQSILNLSRRLLALRRAHPVLATGGFRPLAAAGQLFAFERWEGGEALRVIANLGAEPVALGPLAAGAHRILLSTTGREDAPTLIDGDEGIILTVN
jgi:alpha-glucosidase